MSETLVKPQIPTKMLESGSFNSMSNQKRISRDEEELEELMRQEIEAAQSGSEGDEEPEIQDENNTEQKEIDTKEVKTPEEELEDPEEKSFKKRYGDLRSHMAKKEKAWKEEKEALLSKVGEGAPEIRSEEDIAAWAESNPEVAAMIEAIAERKASEKFSRAEEQFAELDLAKIEIDRSKAESEIRQTHKDFDELRESDKFHDWVDTQPKWVQDALYENSDDAASVIRVIDLYKIDNDLTPSAQKEKKKKAAETVSRKPTSRTQIDELGEASRIRESDVAKMSSKEFEERYEEIQKVT